MTPDEVDILIWQIENKKINRETAKDKIFRHGYKWFTDSLLFQTVIIVVVAALASLVTVAIMGMDKPN